MFEDIITAGSFAALILEGLKMLIRSLKKEPEYDFHPGFYAFLLPIMNILAGLVLAVLDVAGYELPVDWVGFVKMFVLAIIGSAISVIVYKNGIKPLKVYTVKYNEDVL